MNELPESVDRRLTSLEESVGFTDRTAERVSEQVDELNRTVLELERRLARLETRVGDVESGKGPVVDPDADTRPPHSAGPRPDDRPQAAGDV